MSAFTPVVETDPQSRTAPPALDAVACGLL